MSRFVHAACVISAFAAPACHAQVPPTNDVAACSLLSDPTAQRSCRESAKLKRPAPSFDPSGVHLRGAERRARAEGIRGVGGALDSGKRGRAASRRDGQAAAAAPKADPPPEMP